MVTTHSETGKNYLVFSVYQASEHQLINQANHLAMLSALDAAGIPYKPLLGRFAGEHEASVIVPNNSEALAFVKQYCKEYHQQCYMRLENHQHGMYKAYFASVAGESFIGYLRSIPLETINKLNLDYSYRADLDSYFVIWATDTCMLDDFERELAIFEQEAGKYATAH